MVGALIILALIVMAAFAPLIATHSPNTQDLALRLMPPSAENWRHRRARPGYLVARRLRRPHHADDRYPGGSAGGARRADHRRGRRPSRRLTDRILMGITDIFLSMPKLILALAFVAALGPGIQNAVIAIAIATWPATPVSPARETLTIRNPEYISAVEPPGAPRWRVIVNHILPQCTASMIIRLTLDMAGIILTAAGLGFIGLACAAARMGRDDLARPRSSSTSGGWPPCQVSPSSPPPGFARRRRPARRARPQAREPAPTRPCST